MSEPHEDDMLGCSIIFAVVILWGVIFWMNYRDLQEFREMKQRLNVIERKAK